LTTGARSAFNGLFRLKPQAIYPGEIILNPASENSAADSHRWVVFGAFAAVYFFVLFHRVSTSVVAPDLIASFQTNATALGLMSSMYFYAYALEQPLVGYLSDRLGPRRVVGFWSLVAALGCILFGLAPSITWAAIGRGLIGFGVGGVYVPALKAFSQWFHQKEFTTMAGLLMAIGNTGAIVATTPLALSSKAFGWRMSFFLIAAITLSLALVVLLFTRDYDSAVGDDTNHTGKPAAKPAASRKQVRIILTSINFWVLFVTFFGIYGIFVTLQGLWATPYLMSVLQADRLQASQLNMILPVGFIVGAPLFGWIADRLHTKKRQLFIGLLAAIAVFWLILSLRTQTLSVKELVVLFFLMGAMTGGWLSVLWALVRESTSADTMGFISGVMNPAPFFGIAVFQVLTGAVLDHVGRISGTGAVLDHVGRISGAYPPQAFQMAFWVCTLAAVGCLALSFILKAQSVSNPASGID
jgi:sugar phosphate permease